MVRSISRPKCWPREERKLSGKTCLVSGAGNVAQFTIEKLLELGAKVVTFSDSSGYVYDEDGLNDEKLKHLMKLKNVRRARVSEYVEKYPNAVFTRVDPEADHHPQWDHKADCAFPSATQNEIREKDAQNLVNNGVFLISEGANMPTTPEGIGVFLDNKVLFAPGKASNAGGVAVSGLEMSQNSMRLSWSRQEVDSRLQGIMKEIHAVCLGRPPTSTAVETMWTVPISEAFSKWPTL